MAKNFSVSLSANKIRAAAGEKVNIGALFDRLVYVAIYERGEVEGWQCIERYKEKMRTVSYDAEVHDDTTLFDIVADPDVIADIKDEFHTVEVAFDVEVVKDEPQPEPTPTPTPTPNPTPEPEPEPDEKDLGNFMFKYGLLGDIHICEDNDDHSPGDTNDDWWDEADFKAVMEIYAADPDVKFIENVGDIIESGSPKEATPEDDYNVFMDIYNVNYWQVHGMRFFTPVGNHDFYGMYESRYGDTIMPERFTDENSIDGHNRSVKERIGEISIGGQGINGIVPGRGRIVFDTEDGKEHTSGQGDMNFMAFNSYVEMYQEAAGYTKPIAPSENRLSDEAIQCMTDYVMNNWDRCKDNLSSWKDGYLGMRNAYSKLNYWMRKGNHIFVNMSVDYGDDIWPINNEWHDRMIHARQIIDLDDRDPYIKRMKEYVADTQYSSADEPYNYRYYSPNALIWLKEIVENNQDKIIHVFNHHFLPHRVGNGDPIDDNLPKNGGWSYSEINKAGIMTAQGINKGSNAPSGIEFWFLNKLGNQFKNVIFYSGHSHISYENSYHFDNRDYPVVSPNGGTFAYTRDGNTPKEGSGAWFVSIPSLTKPRHIENGSSSRMYQDAEAAFVEVYEKGVKVKCYKIRKDNLDVYDPDKPLVEKTIVIK